MQKAKIFLVMIILLCFGANQAFAQNNGKGLSVEYGTGHYSLKDRYISNEKYAGVMDHFSLGWVNKHESHWYQLELEYRYSAEIKSFNVASEVTQFTIRQKFLYPFQTKEFFQRKLDILLGPTVEFFFFHNEPNIAVSGFDYAQSFAALFSVGINMTGIYQLSEKGFIQSAVDMSALSLGFRTVDDEEEDQSPVKLLTPFSGFNSSFDLRVGYHVFQHLSLYAGYKFELCSIRSWHSVISASDNLLMGLAVDF